MRLLGLAALSGSYVADFSPLLGIDLQSRNTDVVVLLLATDSIQIQFSPAGGVGSLSVDDGSVIGVARMFGDSARGDWAQTTYGGGPQGTFRMVRASRGGATLTASCRP
jgi:hypothetical protein